MLQVIKTSLDRAIDFVRLVFECVIRLFNYKDISGSYVNT